MDISLILKIAGVGLLVAICAQVLQKSGKDEQAMMLTVGGIITVMLMIVGKLGELLDSIRSIFGL